jgi:hypothetical protein
MTNKGRVFLIFLLVVVCLGAHAYGAESDAEKLPLAHLPALRYEFAPVMEGREVTHDFVVQNKGSATLEIQKVKTD